MNELMFDSSCRLCWKGVSLINIFLHRSPSGDPVYSVLNVIYDLNIYEGDGLPSKICSPCLWRMLDFVAYKKNLKYIQSEIMTLISKTGSDSNNVSSEEIEETNDGALETEEIRTCDASKVSNVANKRNPINSEVFIKKEIDIGWKNPENDGRSRIKKGEDSERGLHFSEPSREMTSGKDLKLPKEGFGPRNTEVEKEKSSHPSEVNTSEILGHREGRSNNNSVEKGSSIVRDPGVSEVKDTNTGISDKDRENVAIEGKKSVDSGNSKGPSKKEISDQGSKKVHCCNICKKRFELKHDLSRHMWLHYDKMPYSCKVCGERFRRYTLKREHEYTHLREERNRMSRKGKSAKTYPCGTCRKEFGSQSALRQHSESHSKKYLCNFCRKCFENNDDLKDHLRTHSKKTLWCDICQKSFHDKNSLNSHMDSHSMKPFKCSLCTKMFKTRKSRDQHELTHPRKK